MYKKGVDTLVLPIYLTANGSKSYALVKPIVVSNRDNMDSQPVNLKLCLYGGKEATIERTFVKSTTLDDIQQEMRKVFNIGSERETKLWINSSIYTFKPIAGDEQNNVSSTPSSTSPHSDVKENNVSLNNSLVLTNGKNSNATASTASSPIKLPPTPPPMPTSSTNSPVQNSTSSPNVITRQAAQSMSKQQHPIALPDSTSVMPFSSVKSPNSKSTTILSTSESLNSNSTSKDTSSAQTLSEAGVTDSAVVTLEVINSDGTWPSSRPRYGVTTSRSSKAQPGLCGLSNMGNTCFMNAALQCLSNSPPLTNYILSDKFVDDINTSNPLGMHGEIVRTYAQLIKVIWSGNHTSFLPREFKCAVSRFAPQFTGFAQQDCQELMAFLLDGLHEDLNRIKNKPYIEVKNDAEPRPDEEVAKESWDNYKKRNDSIVVDTFHAMLKSTLVCPECKLVSVTFDPFCYLSLPLPVKREKQVNLTFLPAPARLDAAKIKTVLKIMNPEDVKIVLQYGGRISSFDGMIEEHAGYNDPNNRPKGCKMQVPRSGPASELCDIVARIINEERPDDAGPVKQENLVVAELAMGIISKVYESSEHYNQISDDIVVIEKASNYVLPLYLKEKKGDIGSTVNYGMSRLLFLHVPDLKYETFYKSIIASLSNLTTDSEEDIGTWCRLNAPNESDESMECDGVEGQENGSNGATVSSETADNDDDMVGDTVETNGQKFDGIEAPPSPIASKPAFELSTVNSFGNHPFEILGPHGAECDYSSKLYLGATISSSIAAHPQFEHIRTPKSESVDTFTPKVSPKPTLQLKDCITQFTNAERLGADDPWYCPKCKKHQQAIKKFDIWSLPEVLIIHLKRFSFSRSWRDKIDTLVEFPVEGLDMSTYVHNPEQKKQESLTYSLIGVANHFGGLGGGHYTAYAKNAIQNAWYSFDDALVTPTSANNVVTRSAYVLFYQLQGSGEQQAAPMTLSMVES